MMAEDLQQFGAEKPTEVGAGTASTVEPTSNGLRETVDKVVSLLPSLSSCHSCHALKMVQDEGTL